MSELIGVGSGFSVLGKDAALKHASTELETYLRDADSDSDRILRDRQVEVMQDLQGFLADHPEDPRGYISLPTGVGKTVLFTELIKATGLRTLVVVPTKVLLHQTERAFERFGDPADVGSVYSGQKRSDLQVTITTYATFVRQTKRAHEDSLIAPGMHDLIVLDEAHRALADASRRALTHYSDAIQIGFTASEDYSDKRRLREILPTEIHKMTIPEAIKHGLISHYQNIVLQTDTDLSKVGVTPMNEYDANELDGAINNEPRNRAALELYQKHFLGQKAILFCSGVEHAKNLARLFEAHGVTAQAMYGGMKLDEQIRAKERFAAHGDGAIDVLTNDKLLTEGFDVPAAELCFNLAPTLSRVRAQQRGGRILRLDPGNPDKRAVIIDFVDKNYQKPPVLFSDLRVAQLAATSADVPQNISKLDGVSLGRSQVITDVGTVTAMAKRFYERSQSQDEYAPDGWMSVNQICLIYKLDPMSVRLLADDIVRDSPQDADRHLVRYSGSRTKRTYFAPSIVQQIVELQGQEYFDFIQAVPEGWIEKFHFEDQYSDRVLRTLYRYSRNSQRAVWMNGTVAIADHEFFSPELIEILKQGEAMDDYCRSAAGLCAEFTVEPGEIEKVCQIVARRNKQLAGTYPVWLPKGGEDQLFLFPISYDAVRQELEKKHDMNPSVDDLAAYFTAATSVRNTEAAEQQEIFRVFGF